jgi:hypothetical protein
MSYMVRTQRVDMQWLHERCIIDKDFELICTPTDSQAADILTKFTTNKHKWNTNMGLINHFHPSTIKKYDTTTNVAVPALSAGHPPSQKCDVIPKGSSVRTIVEVCAGPQSIIGKVAEDLYPDCTVIRVTEESDFTKKVHLNTYILCVNLAHCFGTPDRALVEVGGITLTNTKLVVLRSTMRTYVCFANCGNMLSCYMSMRLTTHASLFLNGLDPVNTGLILVFRDSMIATV